MARPDRYEIVGRGTNAKKHQLGWQFGRDSFKVRNFVMANLKDSPSPAPPSLVHLVPRLVSSSKSVMVVDKDRLILRYVRAILEQHECEVTTCESGDFALECMKGGSPPQVVLLSNNLPDMQVADFVPRCRKLCPDAAVALMLHVHEYADLMPTIRTGTHGIVLKPFGAEDLLDIVMRPPASEPMHAEKASEEISLGGNAFFVYASPAMREIQEQAALVAKVDLPVLILGESGTGKEVLTRYIHQQSNRAKNPFLKVNCAAMPSELLESELFGYEQGAFTGANRAKPGKFQQCNNGTMFLDEIGEMPPVLQAKLLQVLQDGTFSRLGSRTTDRVNVRIVAATNIDMKVAIAQKSFREDLYYRLNGFSLKLPPLRERRDEIPVMINHFMRRFSGSLGLRNPPTAISTRLMDACVRFSWPGNLRELENFVKRYLVLGDEELMMNELSTHSDAADCKCVVVSADAITDAINTAGGSRKRAAEALGLSYKSLLNRLRKLGLDGGPSQLRVS